MAKATVEMTCPTCGKTYKWSTTKHNRREANDWEEWASGQERECPECYAESLRKAREAEAQKALEEAKNNPFNIDIDSLDLGGSEKQNAWAKKILAQYIAHSPKTHYVITSENAFRFAKIEPTGENVKKYFGKNKDEAIAKIGEAIKMLNAREIIDNRDSVYVAVADKLAAIFKAQDKDESPAPIEEAPKAEEAPYKAPEAKPQLKAEEWRKIPFNAQNVVTDTEHGILIQMPHKSEYDGFKFWTSKRLIREGRHSYEYMLSVNGSMKFKLIKNGNGKTTYKKVIAECELTADELADAFGGYTEVSNNYHEQVNLDREEIIRHTPEPLAPIEDAEADPELVR